MKETGGNIKAAIVMHETGVSAEEAGEALRRTGGFVREAVRKIKEEK